MNYFLATATGNHTNVPLPLFIMLVAAKLRAELCEMESFTTVSIANESEMSGGAPKGGVEPAHHFRQQILSPALYFGEMSYAAISFALRTSRRPSAIAG
ncbi:MAG: hypothetical protein LC794_09395 [Acidobacteria bacterium]|nr:hypothetical protein [Acidobacteriota bacterium]